MLFGQKSYSILRDEEAVATLTGTFPSLESVYTTVSHYYPWIEDWEDLCSIGTSITTSETPE